MAIMRFLPELQEFLKENNRIYTVRRFKYDPKVRVVYIPGVGACRRTFIETSGVTKDKLEPYYERSGFKVLEDWWNKIRAINPTVSSSGLFLYEIEVVRRVD